MTVNCPKFRPQDDFYQGHYISQIWIALPDKRNISNMKNFNLLQMVHFEICQQLEQYISSCRLHLVLLRENINSSEILCSDMVSLPWHSGFVWWWNPLWRRPAPSAACPASSPPGPATWTSLSPCRDRPGVSPPAHVGSCRAWPSGAWASRSVRSGRWGGCGWCCSPGSPGRCGWPGEGGCCFGNHQAPGDKPVGDESREKLYLFELQKKTTMFFSTPEYLTVKSKVYTDPSILWEPMKNPLTFEKSKNVCPALFKNFKSPFWSLMSSTNCTWSVDCCFRIGSSRPTFFSAWSICCSASRSQSLNSVKSTSSLWTSSMPELSFLMRSCVAVWTLS